MRERGQIVSDTAISLSGVIGSQCSLVAILEHCKGDARSPPATAYASAESMLSTPIARCLLRYASEPRHNADWDRFVAIEWNKNLRIVHHGAHPIASSASTIVEAAPSTKSGKNVRHR